MIFLTAYYRNKRDQILLPCQSVEDNFKDTLKKLKNLDRVIICQININSIKLKQNSYQKQF